MRRGRAKQGSQGRHGTKRKARCGLMRTGMGRQAWSVKEGGEGHLHGTARQGRRGEVRKAWSGFDRQGSTRQAGIGTDSFGKVCSGTDWERRRGRTRRGLARIGKVRMRRRGCESCGLAGLDEVWPDRDRSGRQCGEGTIWKGGEGFGIAGKVQFHLFIYYFSYEQLRLQKNCLRPRWR